MKNETNPNVQKNDLRIYNILIFRYNRTKEK